YAPRPTGRLHLGHAYYAILAHARARAAGGRFLVRMEDLDPSRVRDEYYRGILDDLDWLGLGWDGEVVCQSHRSALYERALARLTGLGLTYRCQCSRRDIADAASAPQENPGTFGLDGPVYPGTCRDLATPTTRPTAIRLDLRRALEHLGGPDRVADLTVTDTGTPAGTAGLDPERLIAGTGDIVLKRRDNAIAYHLAVVVDDAAQHVTHVTRGDDLRAAAPVQKLIQTLLGLPGVIYHHHRLIRDDDGKRLAKRHNALALETLREGGATPAEIRRLVGLDGSR
ncbi:MAG: tRNA glutamyl-Q(34) synthetase GluQRS, partial [Pseudomonadota bacterium]